MPRPGRGLTSRKRNARHRHRPGGGDHKEFENNTPIPTAAPHRKNVHDLTLAIRRKHHQARQSTKENP